jgi:hypothetical protein
MLVALVAGMGLASALTAIAGVPMWIDVAWRGWQAFTQGEDAVAAFQTFSPAATVSNALLTGLVRVITDTYACVATTLIYRDVRRRMQGEDLEGRILALEAAR